MATLGTIFGWLLLVVVAFLAGCLLVAILSDDGDGW